MKCFLHLDTFYWCGFKCNFINFPLTLNLSFKSPCTLMEVILATFLKVRVYLLYQLSSTVTFPWKKITKFDEIHSPALLTLLPFSSDQYLSTVCLRFSFLWRAPILFIFFCEWHIMFMTEKNSLLYASHIFFKNSCINWWSCNLRSINSGRIKMNMHCLYSTLTQILLYIFPGVV